MQRIRTKLLITILVIISLVSATSPGLAKVDSLFVQRQLDEDEFFLDRFCSAASYDSDRIPSLPPEGQRAVVRFYIEYPKIHREIVQYSLYALSGILGKYDEAFEFAEKSLSDTSRSVRQAAVHAFLRSGYYSKVEDVLFRDGFYYQLLNHHYPESCLRLTEAYLTENKKNKILVVNVLKSYGIGQDVETISKYFLENIGLESNQNEAKAKIVALEQFKQVKSDSLIPTIKKFLDDDSEEVKEKAAEVMNNFLKEREINTMGN